MSTLFGHKLSPEKGAKLVAKMGGALLAGEEVYFVCKCNNMKPMTSFVVITNFRLFGWGTELAIEFPYSSGVTAIPHDNKEAVTVTSSAGSHVFKMLQREDHQLLVDTLAWAQERVDPQEVVRAYDVSGAVPKSEVAARLERAKARIWPQTQVVGSRLTGRASEAVLRLCHGDEQPWLILSSMNAGVLAAWDDRLAIIKTGALTSMMAGSFGGERAATFHYRDVTGIEYNSGLMNGVLEILTPSYSGTANKDFWRGTMQGRNADANDPFTLSNTLPLMKADYKLLLPQINELRQRIGGSKNPTVYVSAPPPASAPPPPPPSPPPPPPPSSGSDDFVTRLRELADLRDAGVLTEEEFAAAKQRILDS